MNSSSKKPSYTGKNVFIGIDVHKRTYSVVSVVEGIVVKRWQTSAVPDQLARQLKSYFPEAKLYSTYEAGFSGFVLHRGLCCENACHQMVRWETVCAFSRLHVQGKSVQVASL